MSNTRKQRKVSQKGGVVIGLIFADWCGHCQALKPEWDSMKKMVSKNKECKIVEIDADVDKDQQIAQINIGVKGEKLVANGFPTVFKKKNGRIEYYDGERTAKAIGAWAMSHAKKMKGGYILRKSRKRK
jgi:thiol-disulfide isomerase/thioredoxin